jgi:homoserine kinase type II
VTKLDLTAVRAHFPLVGSIQLHPQDMAVGWSGSAIWRVTAAGGEYCLRRWPAGQTPDRLRLIYQVLTHAAAQGIDYVPVPLVTADGNPYIWDQGNFWELTPWMPGVADFRANPSAIRLAAAMEALALFHRATDSLASGRRLPPDGSAAPAIVDRLELIVKLLGGDFDRLAQSLSRGLNSVLDRRTAQIMALTRHRLAPLREPLATAAKLQLTLQPAIRDVHHDHLLFTGDRVTGLIDFGALRIDTPLADMARLVGSLVADDQPRREQALAAYAQLRPLAEHDRTVIDLLDQCNVVLSGLSWLRWLYLDRRDMGPLPPILSRLDQIIARLNK